MATVHVSKVLTKPFHVYVLLKLTTVAKVFNLPYGGLTGLVACDGLDVNGLPLTT